MEARRLAERSGRVIAGSNYLGMIVPESPGLYNTLGIAAATEGRLDEAVEEFSHALTLDSGNAATHWHLGVALASVGRRADEAAAHFERALEINPQIEDARRNLEAVRTRQGRRGATSTQP